MITTNTAFKINRLKTGTSKRGQPYWTSTITDYAKVNDKLVAQGFFSVFVWGQPIATEGEKVYIHEITSVSVNSYRNQAGGFSKSYAIGAKCGREPLKGGREHESIAQNNSDE
jgi:hypothetical protein